MRMDVVFPNAAYCSVYNLLNHCIQIDLKALEKYYYYHYQQTTSPAQGHYVVWVSLTLL